MNINNCLFKDYAYLKYFGISEQAIDRYFLERINSIKDNVIEGDNYIFKESEFDTEVLLLKTAKILYIYFFDNNSIDHLFSDFKKRKIEYATVRLNASDQETINFLERNHFETVDGYLTMLTKLPGVSYEEDEVKIRKAESKDKEILKKNIAPTFLYSRFFKDRLLTKDSAIKMHELWIENSINQRVADCVLVAEINNEVVGFITLEMDKDAHQFFDMRIGHIPLIGVDPKFRGLNIATKLTQAAFATYFKEQNAQYIRIETQLINIPAIRRYESLGFSVVDTGQTLRWCNKQ